VIDGGWWCGEGAALATSGKRVVGGVGATEESRGDGGRTCNKRRKKEELYDRSYVRVTQLQMYDIVTFLKLN
jgi:hypothetical protein